MRAGGNALVILVTGTGERTAESYNGSSTKAPLLHVEYEYQTSTASKMRTRY